MRINKGFYAFRLACFPIRSNRVQWGRIAQFWQPLATARPATQPPPFRRCHSLPRKQNSSWVTQRPGGGWVASRRWFGSAQGLTGAPGTHLPHLLLAPRTEGAERLATGWVGRRFQFRHQRRLPGSLFCQRQHEVSPPAKPARGWPALWPPSATSRRSARGRSHAATRVARSGLAGCEGVSLAPAASPPQPYPVGTR